VKQNFNKVLALLLVLGGLDGCCANPGVLARIDASMKTVQQAYYDFSGQSKLDTASADAFVALGGAAADAALALGGTLQSQWCPDPAAAEQLAVRVKALPLVAGPGK
jgi:hypothetical protein